MGRYVRDKVPLPNDLPADGMVDEITFDFEDDDGGDEPLLMIKVCNQDQRPYWVTRTPDEVELAPIH